MTSYLKKAKVQTAFAAVLAALFVVFLVLLFAGDVENQSNLFFLGGADFQADALNTEAYARDLDPYGFGDGDAFVPFKDANYPPLAYCMFYLMDLASGRDITTARAMNIAVGASAFSAALLLTVCYFLLDGTRARRAAFAAALLVSGTMLFSVERGNIILLAAALCGAFLLGYRSEKPVLRELAFLALAVAAALKIFPALFGLLLLSEKRWKEALRLAAYGAVLAFLPFFFIKGGFSNLPLLLKNFGAHTAYYTRYIYPRFGFRLFASMAYDAHWANAFLEENLWRLGNGLYRFMPAVDAALSVLCAVAACNAKRPLWQRAAALALVMVNYPVNSGAYTALYLFPVIALYLSGETLVKADLWRLALFVLILNPVQIGLPYRLLGMTEEIMINTTGMLRNLAAYALFVAYAATGATDALRFLKGRREKPSLTKEAPAEG